MNYKKAASTNVSCHSSLKLKMKEVKNESQDKKILKNVLKGLSDKADNWEDTESK